MKGLIVEAGSPLVQFKVLSMHAGYPEEWRERAEKNLPQVIWIDRNPVRKSDYGCPTCPVIFRVHMAKGGHGLKVLPSACVCPCMGGFCE